MIDLYGIFHLFFRWLHVIAGIVWIGHLYFFNFVNIQLQGSLDDATKKVLNPQLMPRALWWFRSTEIEAIMGFARGTSIAQGAGNQFPENR